MFNSGPYYAAPIIDRNARVVLEPTPKQPPQPSIHDRMKQRALVQIRLRKRKKELEKEISELKAKKAAAFNQ